MRSIVVVAVLGGCSFAFVHGPPQRPVAKLECTIDRTTPTVDLVTGALATLLVVGIGSEADPQWSNAPASQVMPRGAWVAGFTLLAAVEIASAGTGFARVAACRAKAEQNH